MTANIAAAAGVAERGNEGGLDDQQGHEIIRGRQIQRKSFTLAGTSPTRTSGKKLGRCEGRCLQVVAIWNMDKCRVRGGQMLLCRSDSVLSSLDRIGVNEMKDRMSPCIYSRLIASV